MKKYFLALILLFSSFVLVSCANVDRDINFDVLSIKDIEEQQTTIRLRTTAGVVGPVVKDLIRKFEAEYSYITVIHETEGTYENILNTVTSDINVGIQDNIPDLVIGYPDHFAVYYGGRNLVNLQAFIEDREVGYSKAELDDFIPSYLDENRGFDPKNPNDLYGLPFNKSTEVLLYNKTAFEALYGANYEEKVPKTWDEVRTISEDIVERVKRGELDNTFEESYDIDKGSIYFKVSDYFNNPNDIKFYPFGYDSTANAFITLTRQFGGAYTSRDDVYNGYVEFNNEESKTAMKYFQDLKNDGLFATPAVFDAGYTSKALNAIRVLMTVGSTAGVGYNVDRQFEYELAAAPIPYKTEDKKYVIQQGTNLTMLNHNTDEQKLAAWLFIKYVLSPENTADFAMETGGYLPVRASAYELEEYVNYLKPDNPRLDKRVYSAAANVALNVYFEEGYEFFVDPAFLGSSKIRAEVEHVFDAIIGRNADIETRYEDAYRALSPYVRKN